MATPAPPPSHHWLWQKIPAARGKARHQNQMTKEETSFQVYANCLMVKDKAVT
jgi:hypothetical protein